MFLEKIYVIIIKFIFLQSLWDFYSLIIFSWFYHRKLTKILYDVMRQTKNDCAKFVKNSVVQINKN